MNPVPASPDLLTLAASLGVGGILALAIFLAYRKDCQRWQDAWKGQSEMLVQVVKENTAAVTALVAEMRKS